MNKKIASEFAIGVLLLVAIVLGGSFWIQEKKQQSLDNTNNVNIQNPVEKLALQPKRDGQALNDSENKTACVGHLYEGEALLNGSYTLDTIPGTTKKDWMFKVAKEDLSKLPAKDGNKNVENVDGLIYIADATPEMITKLKKTPNTNITIKGIYLDCEGVPVVSIEPARIALAKYLKK